MEAKKQAALEVLLAALAVREDDVSGEFPDELHALMINEAVEILTEKPQPSGWLGIADYICHDPFRRPS